MIVIDYEKLNLICSLPVSYWIGKGESYYYINSGKNVLGVAHVDSVLPASGSVVLDSPDDTLIYSHVLDDRLGVYALLNHFSDRADILLTDNEEIGRSTIADFISDKNYNWIFSLDRRGMDVVLYQYKSQSIWNKIIKSHFTIGTGSYSCIADSRLGVCGVNFGIGYYNEHYYDCYAMESDVIKRIKQVRRFIDSYGDKRFEYSGAGRYGSSWGVDYSMSNTYYKDSYGQYKVQCFVCRQFVYPEEYSYRHNLCFDCMADNWGENSIQKISAGICEICDNQDLSVRYDTHLGCDICDGCYQSLMKEGE